MENNHTIIDNIGQRISPIIFIICYCTTTSNYFKDKEIFFNIELPHIDLASFLSTGTQFMDTGFREWGRGPGNC